jgi:hypothetical protein
MTGPEIRARMEAEAEDTFLLADGFDDALVGVIVGCSRPPVACYDYAACVRVLMERDGMDYDTAAEFLDFNTVGAFAGELTPLFLHDWRSEPAEEPVEDMPAAADAAAPAAAGEQEEAVNVVNATDTSMLGQQATAKMRPCEHCGTVRADRPRSPDRYDNWLCARCAAREAAAEEGE